MTVKAYRIESGVYRRNSVGMLRNGCRIYLVAMILSVCADRAEGDRHPSAVRYGRGIVAKLAGVGVDGADILIVGMEAAMPRVGPI